MFRPGNYDQVCGYARELCAAEAVALIVLNGRKGSGFSVQVVAAKDEGPSKVLDGLPAILRNMADQIDADIQQRKTQ